MKKYDLAFSLGSSCSVTQALRAVGLQYVSYPFDWVATPGLAQSVSILTGGFRDWLDKDALRLVDVRHGIGFMTRIYRNEKTGIGFSHEFSDFVRFEVSYPKVKEIYDRRIARFLADLKKAKRMLAVYSELPIRTALPDEEIIRARRTLADAYPGAEIDLVYFWPEPGRCKPSVRELAPGVSVVGVDYRKYDDGEITHFIDNSAIIAHLRTVGTMDDPRTEDEKRDFLRSSRASQAWQWGPDAGPVRRRFNQWTYKLYRHLEKILVRRGFVQKEGPLWFVDR